MPQVGFEPTISAGERPKTYALDRAATGTGGGILVLFIYTRITRLVPNEKFSPPKKIHREVGRSKYLPAPQYIHSHFSPHYPNIKLKTARTPSNKAHLSKMIPIVNKVSSFYGKNTFRNWLRQLSQNA